tara:strand:- start:4549 stop:6588 length:2040 start_codon:yes stop_codon:yes gene_type:complete
MLKYRPEIDGLRAIAVLAVIFYHFQITFFGNFFFSGGFIGVDIFFVVSGYLISSIILRELNSTNNFSFIYFYERRVRRLLPVLFLVMIVSLPAGWMYLLPEPFVDYSKSVLSSLTFVSNFYFWIEGQQYAAESALIKPFLHTWSLSVEEQFYIIFPILLLFFFKLLRQYIFILIVALMFLSLTISTFQSFTNPAFNFYILSSRIWELLAGSALAYLEIGYGRKNNQHFSTSLSALGLILIIASIIFFNEQMPHPSFYTVIPVLGTMLIIWFLNKKDFIYKILSSKLFVGIGLISYSLYIWHYPIMAFDRIKEFSPSGNDKIQWLILTFILSIISYFLVERPFRNKNFISRKVLFTITFFTFIFIAIMNLYVIKTNGFANSLSGILQKEFVNIEPKNRLKNSKGKICHGIADIKDTCNFNTKSNNKIYLIGDSHLAAIMFELKNEILDKNYQFSTRTAGGCWYLPNFTREEIKKKIMSKECTLEYRNELREEIINNENSIVIIGGRLPVYLSGKYFNNKEGGIEDEIIKFKYRHVENKYSFKEGFKKSIFEILNNNKVILIYPIPEVGWNVPNKIFSGKSKRYFNEVEENYNNKILSTSYKVYQERTKESFEYLNSIKHENLYRVFPHTLFCNNQIKNRCITHDEKNIFYFDDNHLSAAGSKLLVDLIIKEIENIESKEN